ncbi:MAG: hypothetical protein A2W23_01250 [Planctomycetes bacterium RBG_16_43_13]|nr:MAG: hypothetical protein A2W23_01250 [Planctomycetes bacterium RBG_16_43_13]
MGWLTNWQYRQQITISSNNIGLSGDLNNVPVVVHVPSTNTNFWTNIKTDGTDVRFTLSDGTTLLSFEIESFDNTGDDAWYHIKVPTLTSASATNIYVYYGNAGATSGEDITGTWNSTFKAVYHLNVDKAAGAFVDSTSNSNNGTNTASTDTAGQVDRCRNFTATQYITVNDSDSLSFGNGTTDQPFTIAFSINLTSLSGYPGISKGSSGGDVEWLVGTDATTGKPFMSIYSKTGGGFASPRIGRLASNALSTGVFYRMVATYDGSAVDTGIKIFIDGAEITTASNNNGIYNKTNNSATSVYINRIFGASDNGGSFKWDEAFICQEQWSLDRIKADNQSVVGSWLSFGSQVSEVNISPSAATFNFTGKIPSLSVVPPIIVAIPSVVFNFSRYAPGVRTSDTGIGIPKADFNFTEEIPTVGITLNQYITIPQVGGNFIFDTKIPVVILTNMEEEITWGLFDANGNAIIGESANTIIKVRRRQNGYLLDWSDNVFKISGGSLPSTTLTELDSIGFAGYYYKILNVGVWPDGWYVIGTTYNGTPKQNGSVEMLIKGGQISEGYNSSNLNMTLSTVNDNVLTRLATSAYTAPDNNKIAFVEKWILNKLIENPVGDSITLYDDDGITPLKTWAYNSATKTRSKAA